MAYSSKKQLVRCRAEKAQVTVLLPGNCSLSEWSDKVDYMPHSWPKSFNIGKMQMDPVQANTFHLHCKFARARHMWLSLKPDWHLLATHLLNGQEYMAMKKSMTDCLPTLVGMTISRILGRTCLWRTVSDSISGAENCTVTRRSSAHWPVMSEGSKHVCSINCCIRSWLEIFRHCD